MASLSIMVGGAVLNAAAFISSNYLVKAFGGCDKAAEKEREHSDKAMEAFKSTYKKYMLNHSKLRLDCDECTHAGASQTGLHQH